MEELVKQIDAYKSEMEGYTAADAQGVEAFRIKYLGTKGLEKRAGRATQRSRPAAECLQASGRKPV
jgi:hypothetical protein